MEFEYLPKEEKIKCYPKNNIELKGIKSYLTRYEENYRFNPLFKLKLWDGKNTKFNKTDNTFPMGLWKEGVKCCQEFGYSFKYLNGKEFPLNRDVKKKEFLDFIKDFFSEYKYQPRDYQLDAAWEIIKNRYGNIAVATSGGKTLIYSMILFFLMTKYPGKKFLLIVPSKTLVTQFYDDVHAFNYRNQIDLNIQEIYGATEKPRTTNELREPDFVISTFQSLIYEDDIKPENQKVKKNANGKIIKNTKKKVTKLRYPKEWYKQFWSVSVDEGHRSKSLSFTKKILKSTQKNAYYRWGMSGSFPKDDTNDMMEIMAKTGPVLYTVKAKTLMDEGFISKVKIRCLHVNHHNYDFAELLEIVSMRDKKAMYDLEMAKVQVREDRTKLINDIVNECDSTTLVLFHNTEYGENLFEYLKTNTNDTNREFYFIDGKVNNKKRSNIKVELGDTTKDIEYTILDYGEHKLELPSNKKIILLNGEHKLISEITENDIISDINFKTTINKELKYINKSTIIKNEGIVKVLVASMGTVATGWSIPTISNVILTQSFKKDQIIIQSIGRALRLYKDKKYAYIFDIVDIFTPDPMAYRYRKPFTNKMMEHGKMRKKIYDEEEYPYKIINVDLPEYDDPELQDIN